MIFKYANSKCDHCGKDFTKNDDIVICPICGEPQHRDCYRQHNACSHEKDHASGYEWKPHVIESSVPEGEATKVCTRCGARNRLDAESCQLCGAGLEFEPKADETREEPFANQSFNKSGEFDVDGISSKEIEAYLGPSSFSFMPKFRLILQKRGGLLTWSLPAFILGPFYFFYRHMNKIGLILLGLLSVIYVPSIIYALEFFKAYYIPETFGVTVEYSQQILNTFGSLSSAAGFVRMAMHVYCCVFANRFFLDTVINDIKDMHKKFPADDRNQNYFEALTYRGRPAMLKASLIFIGMCALLYAVIFVLVMPLMSSLPI